MKWYNLKSNKCPNCNNYLTAKGETIFCPKQGDCGFKIGVSRFTELVNTFVDKYNRRDKFEDNSGWAKYE